MLQGPAERVEYRAAGNTIAKQRSPNQQQLARGGDGSGVGDTD